MDEQHKWMRLALFQAEQAGMIGEVPIGAVIVHHHHLIGSGYNLRETSENALQHAEIMAIEEACQTLHSWRLEDCDMYVTVEPCVMCAGAIVNARIHHLYYGAPDYKAGAVKTLYHVCNDSRLNHQVIVTSGLDQIQAADLMRNFFRKIRQKRKSQKRHGQRSGQKRLNQLG